MQLAGARRGATASPGAGSALVPAALLTAFTTHVATDIASAPLLWVLPLALYLLTFVLAFQSRLPLPMWLLLPAQLAAVIFALLRAGADQARQVGADQRRRRRRLLPCRARRASHAVSAAPAGPLSHRVLSVDVVRRRARRALLGAYRAQASSPRCSSTRCSSRCRSPAGPACSIAAASAQDATCIWHRSRSFASRAAAVDLAGYRCSRASARTLRSANGARRRSLALVFAVAASPSGATARASSTAALMMFARRRHAAVRRQARQAQRSYFGVYRVSLSEAATSTS